MSHNDKPSRLNRLLEFSQIETPDQEDTDCGCSTASLASEPEERTYSSVKWEGVIGVEGVLTGDGRLIEKEALRWEDLPVPIRYVDSDVGSHDGAVSVGLIETLERIGGGRIWGTGVIFNDSEQGQVAAQKIDRHEQDGVSMDLDDVSFEVRVASDLLTDAEAVSDTEETPVTDSEGRVTVMKINPTDEVMAMTDARIRAVTIVSIPAFADARINLVQEDEASELASIPDSVVAAALPNAPSVLDFQDPKLDGPTHLTVTDDGRVYGHLATWDSCHITHSTMGVCFEPPRSRADYAYFHQSPIETVEGERILTGRITVGTGHAPDRLKAKATLAHYDNTGTAAAFVRAGEDQYGIWLSGVVHPDATEKQIRAMATSPVSGDWRNLNNSLELVAALSVNVPGYSIIRPQGLVASGHLVSLVASGVISREEADSGELSSEEILYLKRVAQRERDRALQARAAELASRVAAVKNPNN